MITTVLSSAALLAVLASEPDPDLDGVVPRVTTAPAEVLRPEPTARPYVQASLGGGAVWTRNLGFGGVGPGLSFGLDAGAVLPDRGHRRFAFGGAFTQTGHGPASGRWPSRSSTDLLAKARLGGFGGRVWGYGIVGLGTTIATEDGGDYFSVEGGPTGLLGVGLRIDFSNGTLLGFEADTAVTYLPTDGMLARLSGSVVIGWRFGGRPP